MNLRLRLGLKVRLMVGVGGRRSRRGASLSPPSPSSSPSSRSASGVILRPRRHRSSCSPRLRSGRYLPTGMGQPAGSRRGRRPPLSGGSPTGRTSASTGDSRRIPPLTGGPANLAVGVLAALLILAIVGDGGPLGCVRGARRRRQPGEAWDCRRQRPDLAERLKTFQPPTVADEPSAGSGATRNQRTSVVPMAGRRDLGDGSRSLLALAGTPLTPRAPSPGNARRSPPN